jgi:hypothetical protein
MEGSENGKGGRVTDDVSIPVNKPKCPNGRVINVFHCLRGQFVSEFGELMTQGQTWRQVGHYIVSVFVPGCALYRLKAIDRK